MVKIERIIPAVMQAEVESVAPALTNLTSGDLFVLQNAKQISFVNGLRPPPVEVDCNDVKIVRKGNTRHRQVYSICFLNRPSLFLHQIEDNVTLQYQTRQEPEATVHNLLHLDRISHAW